MLVMDADIKYQANKLQARLGLFSVLFARFILLFLWCYLLQFLVQSEAWAGAELYADCSRNLGGNKGSGYQRTQIPIDVACLDDRCAGECMRKCKKEFAADPDAAVSDRLYIDALNQGLIDECQSQCQRVLSPDYDGPKYFKGNKLLSQIYEKDKTIVDENGQSKTQKMKLTAYKYAEAGGWVAMNEDCSLAKDQPEIYKVLDSGRKNSNFFYNPKINNVLMFKVDRESRIYLRGHKKLNITPVSPNVFTFLKETVKYGSAQVADKIPYFKKRIDRWEISNLYEVYRNKTTYSDEKKSKSVWNLGYGAEKGFHACFTGINNAEFLGLSNSDLDQCWKDGKNNCGFLKENKQIFDCYPKWHWDSSEYLDTGIELRDGDELRITWTANAILGGGKSLDNAQAKPYHYVDHKFLKMMQLVGYDSMVDSKQESKIPLLVNDYNNLLADLSTIKVENLANLVGEGASGRKLEGYDAKKMPDSSEPGFDSQFITCDDKQLKASLEPWYGLRKVVRDQGISLDSAKVNKNDDKLSCSAIEDPGLSEYDYSGVVDGIGSEVKLRIKPYRSNLIQRFIDSYSVGTGYIGGMQVLIEWGGTPLVAGEGLQFALCPIVRFDPEKDEKRKEEDFIKEKEDALLAKAKWFDANFQPGQAISIIDNATLKQVVESAEWDSDPAKPEKYADNLYNIYLRINPELVAQKMGGKKPLNSQIGFYDLDLFYTNKNTQNFFADIIKTVRKLLFGSSDRGEFTGGVVKVMYNSALNRLQTFIRVMVAFFIVITALKYLIGLEETRGDQVLNSVMKLSLVMLVISDKSWEFFSQWVLMAIVDGSVSLAVLMTPALGYMGGDPGNVVNIKDYTEIFQFLYFPFNFLIGEGAFIRIFALMTSGILGFATAVFLIWGIVIFAVTIAKILVIYTFSLLGIAMLSITAPLFVPLILFKFTKDLFDTWLKYFIAYMLYPMFSMTILSVIAFMIFILSQSMLNFVVCKSCIIDIPIIGNIVNLASRGKFWDSCLVYGWTPIFNVHTPALQGISDFFIPDGILMNLIAFWVILHIAKNATDLSSKLVNRMIIFSEGRKEGKIDTVTENMQEYAIFTAKMRYNKTKLQIYKSNIYKKLQIYKARVGKKMKDKSMLRRRGP